MNKSILIFLIITILLKFYNCNINVNQVIKIEEPIELIVNNNINNTYVVGSECGNNSTNSCNSINDAIQYFRNNYNVTVQPLSILLKDGNYNLNLTTINVYQLNVTITPYNQDSNNVIFDGVNSNTIFTISPIEYDNSNIVTHLIVGNIQFTNLKNQAILNVSTSLSFSIIQFYSCNFTNIASNTSAFQINENRETSITGQDSLVYFTLSNFENINQTVLQDGVNFAIPFFYGKNTYVVAEYINLSSLIAYSFVSTLNSTIHSTRSNFTYCKTEYGALYGMDSSVYVYDSSFSNMVSLQNGGAISMINSYIGVNFILVNNSDFTSCSANYGVGGSISLSNMNQLPETRKSSIINSNFQSGTAKDGGALSISNIPVDISLSTFSDIDASGFGGVFSINSAQVSIDSSVIEQLSKSASTGSILSTIGADVVLTSVNFIGATTSNTSVFYCFQSNIVFNDCISLDTSSFLCSTCYLVQVNSQAYCGSDTSGSSTSGSGSSSTTYTSQPFTVVSTSTTTTGGHNSANTIILNYYILSILIFITTIITTSTTLLF